MVYMNTSNTKINNLAGKSPVVNQSGEVGEAEALIAETAQLTKDPKWIMPIKPGSVADRAHCLLHNRIELARRHGGDAAVTQQKLEELKPRLQQIIDLSRRRT